MLTPFRIPAWLLAALVLLAGCGAAERSGGARLATPAPVGSTLPHLALDHAQRPVLSWVEPRPNDAAALVYAVLRDDGWGEPVPVAEGRGWFLNWADFPAVQPLDDRLWAAHWRVKQAGGPYAYDIALAWSGDGGRTWSAPLRPHRDDTPTEHGFVSTWPARLGDGGTGIGLVWLDGRHTVHDPSRTSPADPRTVLQSAVFDPDGNRVAAAAVDDRVCDCCQTGIAPTPDGPVVAYRGRTRGEVRDIHVARHPAAGEGGWDPLGTVADDGWVIDGCPVNGPAIAAVGEADLAVAWYTEAGSTARVQVAFGDGSAWSAPLVVDADGVLGRVGLTAIDAGDVAVSWLGADSGGTAVLQVVRVGRHRGAGEPVQVATLASGRPAGAAQIVRHGEQLLLAWTQWQEDQPRVVTARLPLADLPAR